MKNEKWLKEERKLMYKIVKIKPNGENGEWEITGEAIGSDYKVIRVSPKGDIELIESCNDGEMDITIMPDYTFLRGITINGQDVYEGDRLIGMFDGYVLIYSDSTGFYLIRDDDGKIIDMSEIEDHAEIIVGWNIKESPALIEEKEKIAMKAYYANMAERIMETRRQEDGQDEIYCVEEDVYYRTTRENAEKINLSSDNFGLMGGEIEMKIEDLSDVLTPDVYNDFKGDKHIDEAIRVCDYEYIIDWLKERGVVAELTYYIKDVRRHGVFFTKKAANEHINAMGTDYDNPRVAVIEDVNGEVGCVLGILSNMAAKAMFKGEGLCT